MEKGQYCASYDEVAKRLRLEERPKLNLVKGWFSDTIKTTFCDRVAYVRVYGDLYESATSALVWLTGKLSRGSVLVFDDWGFNPAQGECRAFFEWLPKSSYRFEMIGHMGIGHLYLRCE
jgi:hypothetical protein